MDLKDVVAMTDGELNGVAWTILHTEKPWKNLRGEEGHVTICGTTVKIPDYANDIAVAVSLEPKDKRREYGSLLIEFLGFTFCDMLTWETAMDIAFASARDRTRAFIIAMTEPEMKP